MPPGNDHADPRIPHAYETDFRRRLRAGDTCEMFFDLKDEGGTEGPPGELLLHVHHHRRRDHAATIASARRTGKVDYYDAARKQRQKVLEQAARCAADISPRHPASVCAVHPLLERVQRCTPASTGPRPTGTPILAAGNGTIEEAGRKGYIRQLHPYPPRQRLSDGLQPHVPLGSGRRARREGAPGSGHRLHRLDRPCRRARTLHFEVLVNNQFVDPLSIQDAARASARRARTSAEFTRRSAPASTT